MCTRPITLKVPASAFEQSRGSGPFKYVTVPCGNCFECLSLRQNQLALKCTREAFYKGRISFLTLTYNNEHLPIAQSLWKLDKSTGEYLRLSDVEILSDSCFLPVRSELIKDLPLVERDNVRIYEHLISDFSNEEFDYLVRFTPTLYYRDVRLWLKNSRIRFLREYGKPMSNFTYCIVGEYGMRFTRRPHYHCVFFGASAFEMAFLQYMWSNSDVGYGFGTAFLEDNIKLSDSSRVAAYVAKYVSKGPFETSSVRDGLTIKSRLSVSKYLGLHISKQELFYWRGYFEYGVYDLNHTSYSQDLLSLIYSRLYYTVPGSDYKFKLPRSFINVIFGNEIKNGKLSRSGLSFAYSDFVRNKFVQDSETEFKVFVSNFPSENICEAVFKFECSKYMALQARENSRKENILKSLRRSKI